MSFSGSEEIIANITRVLVLLDRREPDETLVKGILLRTLAHAREIHRKEVASEAHLAFQLRSVAPTGERSETMASDARDAAELLAWWRERMQEIAKRPSSSGHGDADGLLCDAVVALAALLGQEEAGKQLIAAYDAIEKWYA